MKLQSFCKNIHFHIMTYCENPWIFMRLSKDFLPGCSILCDMLKDLPMYRRVPYINNCPRSILEELMGDSYSISPPILMKQVGVWRRIAANKPILPEEIATIDGCDAKFLRYEKGSEWNDLVFQILDYDPDILFPAGIMDFCRGYFGPLPEFAGHFLEKSSGILRIRRLIAPTLKILVRTTVRETAWRRVSKVATEAEEKKINSTIARGTIAGNLRPEPDKIFRALNYFPPWETRVIICGQDPYPDKVSACGLAFAAGNANVLPASLRNIYKELNYEYGRMPAKAAIMSWPRQGVLLLNLALTCEAGNRGSHLGIWEELTYSIVDFAATSPFCVFMIFGRKAEKIARFAGVHPVIRVSHPSPLAFYRTPSAMWQSNCFKKCNSLLKSAGYREIDWYGDNETI